MSIGSDAVFADLRLHEARQAKILSDLESKANWIQAERIQAELHCTGQLVSDLVEGDSDFEVGLYLAVAALLRDPSNLIAHAHRINSVFSAAVGRQAEREWDQRSAA
jgi:hypothetical protein